jgi:transposase
MIDYHTYCEIHRLHRDEHLNQAQIAAHLHLDEKTVATWLAQDHYHPRTATPRPSKLDPYQGLIIRLLGTHPYSGAQILSRIKEQGYTGGYSILKAFVHRVRPASTPAFLTLQFAPGECAQVDWAEAGTVTVGATRRRLYFFLMVLCFSRRMYLEFTLAQTMEHFLACQQHAWEYFGGITRDVIVDNCKVAVLRHPRGQPAVLNPHYLDFANHYGFAIKACAVHQPQQKGRVEKGVDYVKGNFLNGLELTTFDPLNPAARQWLDQVANVRLHAQTHQKPDDLFVQEKPQLRPLPTLPYEAGVVSPVRANSQFRVIVDTNRYSVPARYASTLLTLKRFPDRLCFYHQDQLIAEHVRRYDRHQDYEHPDHALPLRLQRHQAHHQQLWLRFCALSPQAADYGRQLEQRRSCPRHHVQKIVALSEIYGPEKVARALADAAHYHAYSAEYIANILEQRARQLPEPGALHLTRQSDLLELDLPEPDLSVYEPKPQKDPP